MSDRAIKFLPYVLLFSLIGSCMELDVSVPGFPAMAKFFNTNEANIQLTLTVNFLGFCLACLFFGPLSDSFGRKKMMVLGFLLFCLGSFGCTFAQALPPLLSCRFVQGLGASAVWVIAFAIVADTYQGEKAVKFIGIMNTVITGAMALAPVIGAIICELLGWRATYGFIAILSFLSFFACIAFLPETNQNLSRFYPKKIISNYFALLRSYIFMVHCLAPSILCAAYITYVGSASFLYIDQLNMSFKQYALHQSLVVGTFSIISFKLGWFQSRLGSYKTVMVGVVVCTIGTLCLLPSTLIFPRSAYSVTIPMMIFAFGMSLCYGVIFAKSMEIFPDLKGASSALIMGLRVVVCGIGIYLTGITYTGELFRTAIIIALLSVIGIITTILTLQQKTMAAEIA